LGDAAGAAAEPKSESCDNRGMYVVELQTKLHWFAVKELLERRSPSESINSVTAMAKPELDEYNGGYSYHVDLSYVPESFSEQIAEAKSEDQVNAIAIKAFKSIPGVRNAYADCEMTIDSSDDDPFLEWPDNTFHDERTCTEDTLPDLLVNRSTRSLKSRDYGPTSICCHSDCKANNSGAEVETVGCMTTTKSKLDILDESSYNTVVFVLDTGVDWTHETFKDKNGNSRVIAAYRFDKSVSREEGALKEDGTPFDDGELDLTKPHPDMWNHYHGTFCASQVGGNAVGISQEVALVSIKVLGNGGGSRSWVEKGVETMARLCAKGGRFENKNCVANMSLGGKGRLEDADKDPTKPYLDAVAAGVVLFVAAGNSTADARYHVPAQHGNLWYPGRSVGTPGATDFAEWKHAPETSGTIVTVGASK